ncbi:MAG: AAA family ATPase [Myxococcaceae bacterium]|nr:AAA family ATPase [Myxococcaceae bacterium]
MRSRYKTLILWLVLMVLFVGLYRVFQTRDDDAALLAWTALEEAVELDGVERVDVTVEGGDARGTVRMRDGTRFQTGKQPLGRFTSLQTRGAAVVFKDEGSGLWSGIVTQFVPILLLFVFFLFFMRNFQSKGTDLLKFEPAPVANLQPVTLRGLEAARQQLLDAAKAAQAAAPGPRRILITGPAGTGKTSLLKGTAFDAGLPLYALPGSRFVEVFVGVGAARMRRVFEVATASQPCIVAIDDVDAFATRRVLPDEKGLVDERATTLLELNNRLEGLTPMPPRVLFLATTSRPELLDEAFLRRFELRVALHEDGTATSDAAPFTSPRSPPA